MEFKSLTIAKQETWSSYYPGEIAGKITLSGPSGEVTVHLSPERCAEICAIVADGAKETTRKACDAMLSSLRSIGPLTLEGGLTEQALDKAAERADDDIPF